jgi:4-amino-4-deoxy-L-arabinose transferase-like glycosyltransferase
LTISPPDADRQVRFLLLLAALSFAPALAFYYVGEEAIFPISSLEMWHQREWIQQPLFGGSLMHNPLFNWMIIPPAVLLGWEYVLPVTRALTIAATLATAAVVAWLAGRVARDAAFGRFAALVYLTLADVLLYRGWLAYVDPLFGFFVFSAIAALWVACEEGRQWLIGVAVVSITCAFMSKAFTAYVFYAVAVLVLFMRTPYRRLLVRPGSLAWHVAAVAAPLAWLAWLPKNEGQGTRMFNEILVKLAPDSALAYLGQLLGFPLETALRLMPALAVVAYLLWTRRTVVADHHAQPLRIAGWIAFINYLPYWLSPHGNIRYLTPIYPVIALVLALVLWGAAQRSAGSILRWLAAAVVVKFVAAVIIFPYYQSHYRGENYALAARAIIARTAGHALYTTDVSASGLSVAGYIDAWRYPQSPPLRWTPGQWDSGFVLSYTPNPQLGAVAERYPLGGNDLYLLCRGAACGSAAR